MTKSREFLVEIEGWNGKSSIEKIRLVCINTQNIEFKTLCNSLLSLIIMSASKYNPPYPAVPQLKTSTSPNQWSKRCQNTEWRNLRSRPRSLPRKLNCSHRSLSSQKNGTTSFQPDGKPIDIQVAQMEKIREFWRDIFGPAPRQSTNKSKIVVRMRSASKTKRGHCREHGCVHIELESSSHAFRCQVEAGSCRAQGLWIRQCSSLGGCLWTLWQYWSQKICSRYPWWTESRTVLQNYQTYTSLEQPSQGRRAGKDIQTVWNHHAIF